MKKLQRNDHKKSRIMPRLKAFPTQANSAFCTHCCWPSTAELASTSPLLVVRSLGKKVSLLVESHFSWHSSVFRAGTYLFSLVWRFAMGFQKLNSNGPAKLQVSHFRSRLSKKLPRIANRCIKAPCHDAPVPFATFDVDSVLPDIFVHAIGTTHVEVELLDAARLFNISEKNDLC